MVDYTGVLTNIRNAVNDPGEGKTVCQLVAEVREAIRGRGEPTLRAAILSLENTIRTELHDLRNAFTGGPGAPAGGTPVGAGPRRDEADAMQHMVGAARENTTILERLVSLLSESLGGGGGGGHGVTPFESRAFARRVDLVESAISSSGNTFARTANMVSTVFGNIRKEQGALHEQYLAQQRGAALGLSNLVTRTLDVVGAFQKLEHFIKTNIIERYSGYLNNRAGNLSGLDYYLDDFKRIVDTMRGVRPEVGYSNVATQEGIKNSLQSGLTSPLLMYGKSVEQLSAMYRQTINDLEQRGANPRGFGSPAQLQQLIDTVTERQKTLGPFQEMRSDAMANAQQASIRYLGDIAKYTNMSADELVKLVKANTQQISELAAMGILTKQEAETLSNFLPGLQGLGPAGKGMADLLSKYIASGSDPNMFIRNNPGMAQAMSMSNGQMPMLLDRLSKIALAPGDFASKQSQITQLAQQVESRLPQFDKTSAAALQHDVPILSQFMASIRSLAGNAPNLAKPPEQDSAARLSQVIEDLAHQIPTLKGTIGGLAGFVGTIAGHIAGFAASTLILNRMWQRGLTTALANVGGGGGGALAGAAPAVAAAGTGIVGSLSNIMSSLLRFAPIFAGGAAMIHASSEGASTGGVVGAGVGGMGGAAIGNAIGSAIPGIGGVVARIVLSSLGGWLGAHYGQSTGEAVGPAAQAPAVSAPRNVAGPDETAIAAMNSADLSRALHADQMQVLSGILSAHSEGNNILQMMYAELRNQTAAASGAAATPSPQLPARGLQSNTSSFTSPTRAEAGYPYGASFA